MPPSGCGTKRGRSYYVMTERHRVSHPRLLPVADVVPGSTLADDGESSSCRPLRRYRQPAEGVPPRLRAFAPTRSRAGSASRAPRSTASRRANSPRSRRWRSSPSCSTSRCRRCSASASNTSPPPSTYFERMRQIEETSEHIIVLAGPISYLLASDAFDAHARRRAARKHPGQRSRPRARARTRSTRSWPCCASARRPIAGASPASSI